MKMIRPFTGTILCGMSDCDFNTLGAALGVTVRRTFIVRDGSYVMETGPEPEAMRVMVTDEILVRDIFRPIVKKCIDEYIANRRAEFSKQNGGVVLIMEGISTCGKNSREIMESWRNNEGLLFPELKLNYIYVTGRLTVEIYGPEGWTLEKMNELYEERWNKVWKKCSECGDVHRR